MCKGREEGKGGGGGRKAEVHRCALPTSGGRGQGQEGQLPGTSNWLGELKTAQGWENNCFRYSVLRNQGACR